MSEQDQTVAVPETYYPDWWNVNTHRCNHINRTPLFQANYGFGRALFADWGRVGAVKAQRKETGVELIPQISTDLTGKLHRGETPIPLFSPFYASSILPFMKPVPSSRLDSQLIESTESPEESTTIGSEFNSANSLSDPIAGDHAAASILCGKVYGRFRRNQAAFGMDSEQANPFCPDSIRECLKQLEELASTGFQCCSAQEQDAILCKIHALINSSLSKSSTAECDDDWGRLCQILMGEVDASPGRHSNLPKRPRTGLKKSLTTPMFSQFLNNLTQFDTKNVSNGAGYSRWLTGLDPFLIRLATRPVNPLYQGNGLLCQIQHGILSSSSAYSDHPLLLWSPPKPPDLDGDCSSALFFSLWSPEFSSQEERLVGYVGIPAKLLSGSARLCELDAIYADTGSRANILTRWSDTSSTMDNVILFHVNSDESASPKSLPCAMTHMFRPLLPSRGSTMCFNPWLTDEWAVAGNHITSAGDRTAFIRLYTTDSTLPIWSGQVALDDPRETISGINQACCESAGSVNAADNVQTSLFTAFEPGTKTHPRFSVFTDGLRSAPFDHFLRIGYGSDPSQVCLTTSQRMLLMDTRQNSVAHCLFQFRSGDPALDSLFHSTDRFTAVGPRFLEDLYVLAGTAYNMLVLDKRMPTRPVLHWTHSLFGEPTYLNWTKPSGSLRTQYDLPELFVTTCSQNPPGVACVGLNLTGKAGCQLVGPTCSGAALTKVLTGAQNELPSQLMTNKVVNRRLQCTTFCGLTTNVMSHTKNDCHYLGSVVLTSAGDLFMHTWHFTQTGLSSDRDNYSQRCRNWLSELRCNLSTQMRNQQAISTDPVLGFEIDLSEIERLDEPEPDSVRTDTDPDCQHHHYWSFSQLRPAADFGPESEIVAPSQQLVCDLVAYWTRSPAELDFSDCLRKDRKEEEQRRRAELDSCTQAAKFRIQRFKHILQQLVGDVPVTDDTGDEELFSDSFVYD